jgi:hypothetical protein
MVEVLLAAEVSSQATATTVGLAGFEVCADALMEGLGR